MRRLLIVALLPLLAAACVATTEPTEVALGGNEWVLASLGGAPPVPRSRLTLQFESQTAGGYGGCNWYGGDYRVGTRRTLRFDEFSSTARGCLSPPGVEDQEREYLDALGRVEHYRVSANRLVLLDQSNTPLLEFTRREPLPMNEQDLIGTSWSLRSLDGTPPLPGPPIRMTISSAEAIRGFAGCRDFTAVYDARGDTIRVSETRMGATECDAPDAILEQEGRFTTDLSEASHYRLAGDRLELFTTHGRMLVFVRVD